MTNVLSPMFFVRTAKSGKKYFFTALSEDTMKPLDKAEGFVSARTLTEEECLRELDPSVGPLVISLATDELTEKGAKPILIPEFD